VVIRGGAEPYECVHVGDADTDSDRTVGEAFRYFDLVEIARLPIVDRGPKQVAQIVTAMRQRIIRRIIE
jgi:hypothetical protein